MTTSTSKQNSKLISLIVALAWLAAWQIVATLVAEPLFFPSLTSVIKTLVGLLKTKDFYLAVGQSFFRITLGFLVSVAVGTILAAIAAFSKVVRTALSPLMSVVKATPVASFIILALILVSSKSLSTLISFLMALPIIYTNTLSGITEIDKTMFEAADVFGMDVVTRFRHIYFPEAFPYFKAGCSLALGLCWKAGVAAEVIGISAGTIGEKLYDAKIYLDIPELFSYTLVIVAISILFEKLGSFLLNLLYKKLVG